MYAEEEFDKECHNNVLEVVSGLLEKKVNSELKVEKLQKKLRKAQQCFCSG